MRNRLGLLAFLAVLISVSLILVGCERDRPVSTPVPTVSQDTGAGRSSLTAQPGSGTALPAPVPLSGQNVTPAPTVAGTPKSQGEAQGEAPGKAKVEVYTVQDGDTLEGIASLYGLSEAEILDANPDIADPSSLEAGQEITIPGVSSPAETDGDTTGDAGATREYVVQAGDSIASIGAQFGVSGDEIEELNNITDPNEIYVGQTLLIPESVGASEPGGTETYVVQAGDTLGKIAVRYGVTVEALQEANGIDDPDSITVGQVLTIP
jgi:LysM repeat protein